MVEKAKKSAVNDLELALKRVEQTRDMEEKIKNNQYFDDDDDHKSVFSTFSKSSKMSRMKMKGGKLFRGRSGIVGNIIEESRDDSSGTNSKHSKRSGGADSKLSAEVDELKCLVSDLQNQLKDKDLKENDKRGRFSRAKSAASRRRGKSKDRRGNRYDKDNIREGPEPEPYQETDPMPCSMQGWIDWYLGDPEDGGASYCGSRQSVYSYDTDATDNSLTMKRAKKLLQA